MSQRMSLISPVHMNHNLVVAIDVGTTGTSVLNNEIIHVVAIPLAPDYRPTPIFPMFDMKIKPENPASLETVTNVISRAAYADHMKSGVDAALAADLFMEWFAKLILALGKRIIPLGHNFNVFDRPFLMKWLGEYNYDHAFSVFARDTMSVMLWLDDLADMHSEIVPYPKLTLGSLCKRLGVEKIKGAGPMNDAMCHAECYRVLLRKIHL